MSEAKLDSIAYQEKRRALIKAAADEAEQVRKEAEDKQMREQHAREQKAREEGAERLTKQANLLQDITTREMLLDRIREMREEANKPVVIEYPPLSPGLQAQLNAEQEMGRAMVAKAEKEQALYRDKWKREEEEEKKREVQLNPVIHPNPGQGQQFPATGATLKGRR